MRELVRRILWLFPAAFAVSVFAFWLFAWALGPAAVQADLPLFFNLDPKGVADKALSYAERVHSEDTDPVTRRDAAHALSDLGGAALPHLMPYLDSLPPSGRARVAEALAPIALRMGVADANDFRSRETATAFWSRFWLEHGPDFRPMVVQRAVKRYLRDATAARRREVQRFDTFALPELITAMEQTSDPAKLSELLDVTRSIVGMRADTPNPDASGSVAAETEAWRRWWSMHRSDYVHFQGAPRLAAMLQETRYGKWAADAASFGLGVLTTGDTAWDVLRRRAGPSFDLLLAALLGGIVLGPLVTTLSKSDERARRRRRLQGILWLAATLPTAALAQWCFDLGLHGSFWAGLLLCITWATLSALELEASSSHEGQAGAPRLGWAHSRGRIRRFQVRYSRRVEQANRRLADRTPALFATVCLVEVAFSLKGMGEETIRALHDRDLSWLMVAIVVASLVAGFLGVQSDWFERRHWMRREPHL